MATEGFKIRTSDFIKEHEKREGQITVMVADVYEFSSEAAKFAEHVKDKHRIPALESNEWKAFDVDYIDLERKPGYWKVACVWFKDWSCFGVGGKNPGVDESMMLPDMEWSDESE